MTDTTVTYSGTAGLLQIILRNAETAAAGSCATAADPDMWFRDDQSDPDFCNACTITAAVVCQSCPIQSWCEVRADGETVGVWAGRPRSTAIDGRRGAGHTCAGPKARVAARVRAHRARVAEQRLANVSVQRGDIPLKG